MKRRTLTTAIAGVALVAGLSGCGIGDRLVGLHDAPAERNDIAPLNVDGAEKVAGRVLAQAAAARSAKGAEAAKEQAAVLAGAALAQAQAATRTATASPSDPLQKASQPEVVAISQGKNWPRAILVGTLDQASKTQTLHVLMSTAAKEPFKVHASVPMLAGTSVPALGDLASGSPLAKPNDKSGAPLAPDEAVKAYAGALNHPKPVAVKGVGTKDAYATALRASTAAQVKQLGKLGTFTQVHTPDPKDTIAFKLAGGGTVTFGQLARKDVIAAAKETKEFNIPANFTKLVGKSKATKNITINSLESIVLVVPANGEATAVAADEQVVSGSAS